MADLPVASDFNGSTVTEAQFKTAMGLLLENVASRNYADTKKSEAITTAATDATTKANNAQAAAIAASKTYVDANAAMPRGNVTTGTTLLSYTAEGSYQGVAGITLSDAPTGRTVSKEFILTVHGSGINGRYKLQNYYETDTGEHWFRTIDAIGNTVRKDWINVSARAFIAASVAQGRGNVTTGTTLLSYKLEGSYQGVAGITLSDAPLSRNSANEFILTVHGSGINSRYMLQNFYESVSGEHWFREIDAIGNTVRKDWVAVSDAAVEKTAQALSYRTLATVIPTRSNGAYTAEAIASGLIKGNMIGEWIYDTVNNCVYTPPSLTVYAQTGTYYTSGAAQTILAPEADVDYHNIMRLFFDTSTLQFSLYSYRYVLTALQKTTFILCAYIRRDTSRVSVISNSQYRIDCARQGEFLSTRTAEIFGAAGVGRKPLPNYDTTLHTMTFNLDTVFKWGAMTYIVTGTPLVVQCSDPAQLSSAVILYWDTSNNTMVIKKYNTVLSITERYRYVRVATIRDRNITTVTPDWREAVSIDMGIDHTINGIYPFQQGSGGSPNSIIRYSKPLNNINGINHRGWNRGAGGCPENTMPAFKASRARGFKYVETDLKWTSDNVPFLMHDETLDRTSNLTGLPILKTIAEIKAGDFGSWFDASFAGTKAPTLEEFLIYCHKANLHPYVEWTTDEVTPERLQIFVDIVLRTGMYGKMTLISFNTDKLAAVLAVLPAMRVGWNNSSVATAARITTLVQTCATGKNEVFYNGGQANITPVEVKLCTDAGITMEAWVASTPERVIELAEMGVSGISVDEMIVHDILEANVTA